MTEDPVPCALCKRREAAYTCAACGRPVCDPCAAAAPDWRFRCLDCADLSGWHRLAEPEDSSP